MDERKEFEAAMAAAGYECNPPIYRDGTYRFAHYAAGWEMWQAATLAERERAAKVCDAFEKRTLSLQEGPPEVLSNVMLRQVAVLGFAEAAAAIRKG